MNYKINQWIGDTLFHNQQKYIPIKKLDRGGMGSIFMGYHVNTKKLVALKIIDTIQKNNNEIDVL